MAMILRGQRKYVLATQTLEKARAIFSLSLNEPGLGVLYLELSCVNREIDRNALALDYVFKALQIFERGQHRIEIAWAYDNLSVIHLNQFNRAESLSYAKKARAIFLEGNNASSLAWNACNLGNLYQEMGQSNEAENLYLEAQKGFEALKSKQGVAWVLHSLGTLARSQSKFKEAESYLRKAWKAFESLNLLDRAGWSVLNVAGIKWAQGKLDEAASLNKKAQQLFAPLRNNDGLAWCIFQNAQILRDKGRLTNAWQLVRQSLNLYSHIASQKGTGWAECELGKIYWALADQSHARECFLKAKGLADRLEIFPLKAEVEKSQANVFLELGYIRAADMALESSEQLSKKLNAMETLGDVLISKARIAVIKTDFEAAQIHLNEAGKIIESFGLHRLSPALNICQGDLLMSKGKFEEASQVFIESVDMAEEQELRFAWIEASMGLVQAVRGMKTSKSLVSRLKEIEKYVRHSGSRKLKAKLLVLETIVKYELQGSLDTRPLRQALQILDVTGLVLLKKQFLELFIHLCEKDNRKDESEAFQKELDDFLSQTDTDIKLIPNRKTIVDLFPVSVIS